MILTGEPDESGVWQGSPLAGALADEARRLVARLDRAQRLWLSGYLAGAAAATPGAAIASGERAAESASVSVLYGSQTGNAERLAKEVGSELARRGVDCVVLDMLDCKASHLQKARTALVVVSTHGDGDPPERAQPLLELLEGRRAPRLEGLKFSVLALGDSSYEKFCATGRNFDAHLARLGGVRLHPRVDCDVELEAPAREWIAAVCSRIHPEQTSVTVSSVVPAERVTPTPAPVANIFTRKNPFIAPLLENLRLTASGSSKDVRHIELSLEGSGIHHEPGDALGIVPRNPECEVDALIQALRWDADTEVGTGQQTTSLRESLLSRHEIRSLRRPLVERYADAAGDTSLQELCQASNSIRLESYLESHGLLDLVREHPPQGMDPRSFVELLPPLAPRLYSIASSASASPDEIHLTVGVVRMKGVSRSRVGVVSGFLAQMDGGDAAAPVYLQRNPAFRLPAPDAPIVMIGPGTGIAPFRAFLAEREAAGARGRNWLFFGDRSFETDFLYQSEWLRWRKRGLLTRMDVAFSRDQREKVYVQHRMREHGALLWRWLEEEACVYVCGDASRMAADVHQALLQIVADEGAMTSEAAMEYLLRMQRERRYQKDVY